MLIWAKDSTREPCLASCTSWHRALYFLRLQNRIASLSYIELLVVTKQRSWCRKENEGSKKELLRRQVSTTTLWLDRSRRGNADLKYCLILRSILSLRYACVGAPCREAFYDRFYADLQARVYATASSHLVLVKAQSTASTSRLELILAAGPLLAALFRI
jgi:hypothetical protein